MEVHEEEGGDHEHKAVKEGPAGAQNVVVAQGADLPGEDGVAGPHQGRQQGQQAAPEVQCHPAAAPAHQRHPGDGGGEAREEPGAGPLPVQEAGGQQGGEEGGHRHDDPYVGGQGEGEGHVLKEEVEGHPAQSRGGEEEFFPGLFRLQPPGADGEEGQIAQGEAAEQNLHRGEGGQQGLGKDKGGPPEKDGEKGGQMAAQAAGVRHGGVPPW